MFTGKHHTAVKTLTGRQFSYQTDICKAGQEFWELRERKQKLGENNPSRFPPTLHPQRLGPKGSFNFREVTADKGGHQKVLIQVSLSSPPRFHHPRWKSRPLLQALITVGVVGTGHLHQSWLMWSTMGRSECVASHILNPLSNTFSRCSLEREHVCSITLTPDVPSKQPVEGQTQQCRATEKSILFLLMRTKPTSGSPSSGSPCLYDAWQRICQRRQ